MIRLALRMLLGDTSKLFGIVMGVTLASLVITQQGSIFVGIMSRTYAVVSDMGAPDIWVMDPKVQYIDDVKPLQDTELFRVRGVEGVAWAAPLYKGLTRARLEDGTFQNCVILGLEDSTLTGGPPRMLEGKVSDLRRADAVIVDQIGATTRFARRDADGRSTPLRVGDEMELNDRRAVVVGISGNTRSFQSQPLIYTTYSRATAFVPKERKLLSFVLVTAGEGVDPASLCRRISMETGLAAYTREEFKGKTVRYFLENTGIPINFGIAVGLGFFVGTVITGFMFFNFTMDNLRYFGTLKAMGAPGGRLLSMVVVQAVWVALVGYGMGVGLAALMGQLSKGSPLAFHMPWQLLVVSGLATLIISLTAAVVSMHKVLSLEPAAVFKG
ncbi:MAG: FtsX-like permease family protein [Phycisphaerales bacterium]|nr:FtsX-like permease family protein [Phycisphaerales bacterium]